MRAAEKQSIIDGARLAKVEAYVAAIDETLTGKGIHPHSVEARDRVAKLTNSEWLKIQWASKQQVASEVTRELIRREYRRRAVISYGEMADLYDVLAAKLGLKKRAYRAGAAEVAAYNAEIYKQGRDARVARKMRRSAK